MHNIKCDGICPDHAMYLCTVLVVVRITQIEQILLLEQDLDQTQSGASCSSG